MNSELITSIVVQWVGVILVFAALAQMFLSMYQNFLQRKAVLLGQVQNNTQLLQRVENAWVKLHEQQLGNQAWLGLRKFKIVHKVEEAIGVTSFYLKPLDGRTLPNYRPGQFLTFSLNIPGQKKPVLRCYSLSDAPNQDFYRVTIKRAMAPFDNQDAPNGLISNFFHDALAEGDVVDFKAPSGHFYLDPMGTKPLVLIGAGVGLTPVLSMLNALCKQGTDREIWLFYGVRNSSDHAMEGQLYLLSQRHPNVHLHTCYSQPSELDILGEDYNHAGHITTDLMKTVLPHNDFEFYMCGPNPMIDELKGSLAEWNVTSENIHYERFGAIVRSLNSHAEKLDSDMLDSNSVTKDKVSAEILSLPSSQSESVDNTSKESSISVKFARSQKEVTWTPECGSILDLAEANGVAMESGCRSGNCGGCSTAVKEGDVSYADGVDAQPGTGRCLACVAVPKTSLVVDA